MKKGSVTLVAEEAYNSKTKWQIPGACGSLCSRLRYHPVSVVGLVAA